MSNGQTRRAFIAGVATLLPAVAEEAGAAPPAPGAPAAPPSPGATAGTVPERLLGRTNERVSAIGLGGFHIGNPEESAAIRLIHRAIDGGITFMDNCWDYHGGESERRMGKALGGGYREKVFLMTKIDGRTRAAAAGQLEQSLGRLKTDRIDLVQIHEVIRHEDAAKVFAEGGAIEALKEARKAGKIRYIGFTGHKSPAIHLTMLETAAKHDFHFDAVQMPLNPMDPHFESFEGRVLPVLVKEGIGVLGMKTLGGGVLLKSGTVTPKECLTYALSLPTSVVITGIDSEVILDQAFDAARSFRPMSSAEKKALLARTEKAAVRGEFEKFKTSDTFDGTARNPKWLTITRM